MRTERLAATRWLFLARRPSAVSRHALAARRQSASRLPRKIDSMSRCSSYTSHNKGRDERNAGQRHRKRLRVVSSTEHAGFNGPSGRAAAADVREQAGFRNTTIRTNTFNNNRCGRSRHNQPQANGFGNFGGSFGDCSRLARKTRLPRRVTSRGLHVDADVERYAQIFRTTTRAATKLSSGGSHDDGARAPQGC